MKRNSIGTEVNLKGIALEIYRAVKDGDMKRALDWLGIAGAMQKNEVEVEHETLIIEEK